MTILVLSFDYDGCLFYDRSTQLRQDIIKTNQSFLDKIVEEIRQEEYEKVIIAIGTNRQSTALEYMQGTRISALDYAKIQSYLQAQFIENNEKTVEVVLDPFRIVDIDFDDNGSKVGDSFQNTLRTVIKPKKSIFENDSDDFKEKNYPFDVYKISLIFAQMHRVAALHSPETKIVFKFYDDKMNILENLQEAFSIKGLPKPPNLILELHQRGPSFQVEDRPMYIIPESIRGNTLYTHWFAPYLLFYAKYCVENEINEFSLKAFQKYIAELMEENPQLDFHLGHHVNHGAIIEKLTAFFEFLKADPILKEYAYTPENTDYLSASELVSKRLLHPRYDHMNPHMDEDIPMDTSQPQPLEQLNASLKARYSEALTKKINALSTSQNIFWISPAIKITALNYLLNAISEVEQDEVVKETINTCLRDKAQFVKKRPFSSKVDPVSVRTVLGLKRFGLIHRKGKVADSLQIILDFCENEEEAKEIKNFKSTMN